jgi:acyl-coenzyme A synthetase/AMP-(fatty) acid ligase
MTNSMSSSRIRGSDLKKLVDDSVALFADRPFMDTLTYTELGGIIARYGLMCSAIRLEPGTCVAVQIEKRSDSVLWILALLRFGAVPLMLHAHLPRKKVLECAMRAGAKYIVGGGSGVPWHFEPIHSLAEPEKLATGTALIASTSGTTGTPRLVQHSHAAIIANILGIRSYVDLDETSTLLVLRDPSYLSVFVGEVLLCISQGARLIFSPKVLSPQILVNTILNERITMVVGTATLFNLALPVLRKHAQYLQRLRIMILLGEGAHLQTLLDLKLLLPETAVHHCYGLTEAGPRLTYWTAGTHPERPFCVGQPLPGVEFRADKIENNRGETNIGVLEIASPSLMLGYVGDKTTPQRWFPTNDLGWIDQQGLIYVLGRHDDVLVRGGVKIPPAMVEEILIQHPQVLGALVTGQVIGLYDLWIEAQVVAVGEKTVNSQDLLRWCRTQLPSAAWPNAIIFVDQLTVNPSGKLKRPRTDGRML